MNKRDQLIFSSKEIAKSNFLCFGEIFLKSIREKFYFLIKKTILLFLHF